jgi:zinc protease
MPALARLSLLLLLVPGLVAAQEQPKPVANPGGFSIPVDYYKLPNGMRVVLSEDHIAPTAAVAVYYNIGFRLEPKDRTGFAHLFEHLMFEGSKNAPKGTFDKTIMGNGGVINGSTRFDFTNYYQVIPSNVIETVLWLEADRMGALAVNEENLKNQQGVVSNEVKVNVLNQPYGGFPWLDMPQYANTNWYNAHNFYGELKDLEAATLQDAAAFYKTYYAPNNAVLVVVGDIQPAQVKQWISKYFAGIPAAPAADRPDLSEPRQEKEKRASKTDALAKRPALAVGYHVPERNTPEYYAMILLDQLILQGNDSLLRTELVKKRGYTDSVTGGINLLLGNQFNYGGPMLWTSFLFHDDAVKPDAILAAFDGVIESLRKQPPEAPAIELARTKVKSNFYDIVGGQNGLGAADLLASFTLFDDNPARINQVVAEFDKVNAELLLKTAREYLRPENRTVLVLEPKKQAPTAAGGN